jgi:MFS family permease
MLFFFVYGFSIVWVVGVNGPIFSEIVPAKHRTYIFSLDQAFELCISSIGGPLSGYIAERAGFVDENIEVCDRVNGEALATGMVWVMTVPWTVCACLYGVLHLTYPRDRRRVLARVGNAADDMQASLASGPTANEQAGWGNDGEVASGDSCCGCCCGGCVPERDEYTPLKDSDSI